MTIFQSIILAIIEGITEFLPVSSTGHLIIGSSVMGIASQDFTKVFTVAIQLGAILSVVVLYWKRFVDFKNVNFYIRLFVAFLPAVFFGLIFKKHIDALLENVIVVAAMLLLGGIVFLFIDKFFTENKNDDASNITNKQALTIGLFQVISMIPGVSRAAATIIGGLSQKLTRKAAAEFSFFLAVPTMFAATAKSLLDYVKDGHTFSSHEIKLLTAGNIVAFVVALIAIKAFIGFLTKHGFKIFGWYRIIVGASILILYFMGIDLKVL
jgi:undecaprenyl-diphosphatase